MILVKKLWDLAKNKQRIYLYGTGCYSDRLFNVFMKLGMENRIHFIESDCEKGKVFKGKTVIRIQDFQDKEALIIIAVSTKYENEIKNILLEKKFIYVEAFTNYILADDSHAVLERFRRASFKQYCQYIADWYVLENIGKLSQYNNIINELYSYGEDKSRNIKNKRNKKNIVCVVGVVDARTARISNL